MRKKIKFPRLRLVFFLLILVLIIQTFYLISSNKDGKDSCGRLQSLPDKQQCWEKSIENTLKSEGLEAAFNLVDYLYSNNPQFASDCHDFTHLLGEKAYQLFSQNQQIKLSSKASYCGFGFYHSFMENLLRTTNDLDQARKFCDYVGQQSDQNELFRLSCFHGIGHGLLEDIPNPVLKGDAQAIIKEPLEICAKLSKTDIEEYRCASGVFNVLALYYQNPKTGLNVQNNDPYAICHLQNKSYPKKSCYDQMNTLALYMTKDNLKEASKFVEKIPGDEFASEAMHGIAGAYGQQKVGKTDYSEVAEVCNNLQPRVVLSCHEGFLLGLLEGGQPGQEHLEAEKYCSNENLSDGDRSTCFNILKSSNY